MACWMNLPFYAKAYTGVVLTENSCYSWPYWIQMMLFVLKQYILWLILSSDYDIFVNK